MTSTDAFLIALIIIIILLVAFQGRSLMSCGGGSEGFEAAPCESQIENFPYVQMNQHLDQIRGLRNDATKQTPEWQRQPHGRDNYHHAGAYMTPEQISEAEREQWYSASDADNSGTFNTELTQDAQTDTMQYHSSEPAIDYNSQIVDLVVDPRTRENHNRWVEEMKPWSGTAMTVDNMDEAMEATVDFIGLQRPLGCAQYNPFQVTERDPYTFSANRVVNFRGCRNN